MAVDITDDELLSRYAGRAIDHDTRARYRGWLEHTMLVDRCNACGTWHEPPGPVCPSCWSTDIEPTPISGDGTIHLAIYLHQGPRVPGVDYSTPYPVVVVELDEQTGLRMSSTVIGAPNEEIVIGRRVQLDWIDRNGAPMPVFRLTDDPKAAS